MFEVGLLARLGLGLLVDGSDGLLVHLQVYCGLFVRVMLFRGTGVLLGRGSMLSSVLGWVVIRVIRVHGVHGVA